MPTLKDKHQTGLEENQSTVPHSISDAEAGELEKNVGINGAEALRRAEAGEETINKSSDEPSAEKDEKAALKTDDPEKIADDNLPFDWIDHATTFVMHHVLATAFVIAMAGFWLFVFAFCFGR